jgi:hypothetical protein
MKLLWEAVFMPSLLVPPIDVPSVVAAPPDELIISFVVALSVFVEAPPMEFIVPLSVVAVSPALVVIAPSVVDASPAELIVSPLSSVSPLQAVAAREAPSANNAALLIRPRTGRVVKRRPESAAPQNGQPASSANTCRSHWGQGARSFGLRVPSKQRNAPRVQR